MKTKQQIWIAYLWRRSAIFILLYFAETYRFEAHENPSFLLTPEYIYLVFFLFECFVNYKRFQIKSSPYHTNNPLRKVKKVNDQITVVTVCYVFLAMVFNFSNLFFASTLHSQKKQISQYDLIEQISFDSNHPIDYHFVRNINVSSNFYIDWSQRLYTRQKSIKKNLEVTLYGLAPLDKKDSTKGPQYYLVTERSETFIDQNQKLTLDELKPTIDKLSLLAFKELASRAQRQDLCLSSVPDWQQGTYINLIKKAKANYLQGPHYFFYETSDHDCKEGLDLSALFLLCFALSIELLMVPALISTRLKLTKEIELYQKKRT